MFLDLQEELGVALERMLAFVIAASDMRMVLVGCMEYNLSKDKVYKGSRLAS